MGRNTVVDSSFLVALLSRRDRHHAWATLQAAQFDLPWMTCEAVLSESFHLVGGVGEASLAELLRRGAVSIAFRLDDELAPVLKLMRKYRDVPMSLADGCLVRMTEVLRDPLILTTDHDFRVYRRHSRHVVPCVLP